MQKLKRYLSAAIAILLLLASFPLFVNAEDLSQVDVAADAPIVEPFVASDASQSTVGPENEDTLLEGLTDDESYGATLPDSAIAEGTIGAADELLQLQTQPDSQAQNVVPTEQSVAQDASLAATDGSQTLGNEAAIQVSNTEPAAQTSGDEAADAQDAPVSEPETTAAEPQESFDTLTYEDSDENVQVKAYVSSGTYFGVNSTVMTADVVTLAGAPDEDDTFSDFIDAYEGDAYALDLSFQDDEGEELEQLNGKTYLSMGIPAQDDHAVIKDVVVYRQAEDGEVERVEDLYINEDDYTVTFDAGALGSYALCYTVDYYYGDQEYHMAGGGRMLLSELFAQLGIHRDAADVEAIDFTDTSLISFTRYDDHVDWVIESLAPFDTEETMIVTFADGYRLRIDVLDDQTTGASLNLEDFLIDWKINVGSTTYSLSSAQSSNEPVVIEYKDGVTYNFEFLFAESRSLQFDTTGTPPGDMYFQLPDCFYVPNGFQMALNVKLGRKGVLADNIITVETREDGHRYLRLKWNYTDEAHWKAFCDSSTAQLKIIVGGKFQDAEPNKLSWNNVDVEIRRENLHNAYVTKTGELDLAEGVINYVVTVASEGTTENITLTDTLGSALTYQGDIVFDGDSSDYSGPALNITQKTGNTFKVIIPSMQSGEKLVFNYSAKVDYNAIAISGAPSFEETGNTAEIEGDLYDPDNVAVYHETDIAFSNLEKNAISKRSTNVGAYPAYVVTWEIDTNKDTSYPLAGSDITDKISPENDENRAITQYYGDGITIKCYDNETGQLASTRHLTWEQLGVDTASDKTWTYNIPETDPIYRYVVTYDTLTYIGSETIVLENEATGKGGTNGDRVVLTPSGNNGIGISKKAVDVGSTHVTWEFKLSISDMAYQNGRIVLVEHCNGSSSWNSDSLPARWITPVGGVNTLYKETLTKVEVLGLDDNETFVVTYGKKDGNANELRTFSSTPGQTVMGGEETNPFGFTATSNKYAGDYFTLEFFKDDQGTTGLNEPEGDNTARTITVRLTTEFPKEWAIVAQDIMQASNDDKDSWRFEHINWISVDTPDPSDPSKLKTVQFDTDKIMPMPANVYKSVLRNRNTGTAISDDTQYNILNYPDVHYGNYSSNVPNGSNYPNDLSYPVFQFRVLVSGIQYDEPLVIEDRFDTELFEVLTVGKLTRTGARSDYRIATQPSTVKGVLKDSCYINNYLPSVYGMTKYANWPPSSSVAGAIRYKFSYTVSSPTNGFFAQTAEDMGCVYEETETGIRITINNLFKRADGSLYPFYGIDYWVIPKNEEALKQIEEMCRVNAMSTGGRAEVTFENTAEACGRTSSAYVTIASAYDFMPIDKTSTAWLKLGDTEVQLDEVPLDDGGPTPSGGHIWQTPNKPTASGEEPKKYGEGDIEHYIMRYTVELNKGRDRLNDGKRIVAEDTYSDNLSVDFSSVVIETEPEGQQVSYDFSGNVGRFTIPDETYVKITYEAIINASEAQMLATSNTIEMLQYKKELTDSVDYVGISASTATTPAIFIQKYASGHMEIGLNGAKFQLFEYNHPTYVRGESPNTAADWTPVKIHDLGETELHDAVFETSDLTYPDANGKHYGDGYAVVELSEDDNGVGLHWNKVYGLREIETPTSEATNGETIQYESPHGDNFYCYVFSIAENDIANYSNFVYFNEDILTVRNKPKSTELHIAKQIEGNCLSDLTDADKECLTYQLFRMQEVGGVNKYMPIMTHSVDDQGVETDIVDPRFVGITYEQVTSTTGVDVAGLTVADATHAGEYLLVEYGNKDILDNHPDWIWSGSCMWAYGEEDVFSPFMVYDENGQNGHEEYGIEFEVTADDVENSERKSVTIINTYVKEVVTMTAEKRWVDPTGAVVAWPKGEEITLELGTLDAAGTFTPYEVLGDKRFIKLDHVKDASGEDAPGNAVWKNLPKNKLMGSDLETIHYAVRETTPITGYHTLYPDTALAYAEFGSEGIALIRNQVVSTSISVHKAWDRDVVPEGAEVTFRLYSYTGSDPSTAHWVSNVNDITLDGTVDANGEGTAWQADFTGLPEYDGESPIWYFVREISCTAVGYEASYPAHPNTSTSGLLKDYAKDGETITNKPASTTFTVSKAWAGTPGDAWPEGQTIALRLDRKTREGAVDNTFGATYIVAADGIVRQTKITDVYNEQQDAGAWNAAQAKLTVSGLPKYDGEGDAWIYFVSETAVQDANDVDVSQRYTAVYHESNGYPSDGDSVFSGGSITNTLSAVNLTLSKTVEGNMGDRTKQFSFRIALMSGGTPYSDTVAYVKGEVTGSLEFVGGVATVTLAHGEEITLSDIPGGLTYTIVESETDAGDYATTYTVGGDTPQTGRSVIGTLSENTSIAFTNMREVTLPMGVYLPTGAYLAAVPFALQGWWVARRRKRRESESEE